MRFFERLLLLAALLAPLHAHAHKSSDAYLQLTEGADGVVLRIDVALRDLDTVLDLDLDRDADGRLTWGEVKAAWPAIDALVAERVRLAGCALVPQKRGLERRSDGAYAALWLHAPCKLAAEPALGYTLMRDVDPTHRGILKVERAGGDVQVQILDPTRAAPASSEAPEAASTGTTSFLQEGVHHIVTGYDHVLFLLCLLFPAVMRRTASGWRPVERLGQAVWPVAGIVTAFTIAHSITLALAALKIASLPAWFIEPAIAVTIIVAAFDNLKSIFGGHRVLITFLFGLIHGFGFAGVLGELDLPGAAFAWALFRFNLGLELGQLAIVFVAAFLLYLARHRRGYPRWVIGGGSMAAIAVGVFWLIERTADVSLLARV